MEYIVVDDEHGGEVAEAAIVAGPLLGAGQVPPEAI